VTLIESMDDDDSIESLVGLGSRLEPKNEWPKEALPGRRPWLIFDFLTRARMCGMVRCCLGGGGKWWREVRIRGIFWGILNYNK